MARSRAAGRCAGAADWSGDVLDLGVTLSRTSLCGLCDHRKRLLLPVAAPILGAGIVVSGALYFADRRMKTADNHFRGFRRCGMPRRFYLFLLHLPPSLSSLVVAVLIVATFVPFTLFTRFRVARLARAHTVVDGRLAVLAS